MTLSFHAFLLVFTGLTLTLSSKNRKMKINRKDNENEEEKNKKRLSSLFSILTIDIIRSLSRSNNKDIIMVIVDQFTKMI